MPIHETNNHMKYLSDIEDPNVQLALHLAGVCSSDHSRTFCSQNVHCTKNASSSIVDCFGIGLSCQQLLPRSLLCVNKKWFQNWHTLLYWLTSELLKKNITNENTFNCSKQGNITVWKHWPLINCLPYKHCKKFSVFQNTH